jgi:hypothetical protein
MWYAGRFERGLTVDKKTGRHSNAPLETVRRDMAMDESVDSVVATLRRLHRASEDLTAQGGDDGGPRSLVYDFFDTQSRYVRNMLGLMARANDQVSGLFDQTLATPGELAESSIEVVLRRKGEGDAATAEGKFRLRNASRSAVTIDLPEILDLLEDHEASGAEKHTVSPDYRATIGGGHAVSPVEAEGFATIVPAGAILDVRMTIKGLPPGDRAWRGREMVRTSSDRDLELRVVLQGS